MAAEPRLLVVEYLDTDGCAPGADTAPPDTVRGWCGGGWNALFPAALLPPSDDPTSASGWFLVRGHQAADAFVVEELLRRAPLTAPDGAVLAASWPAGAAVPVRRWVRSPTPRPDTEPVDGR